MKTLKVSQQKFIALHFNLRTDLEQEKRKKLNKNQYKNQ